MTTAAPGAASTPFVALYWKAAISTSTSSGQAGAEVADAEDMDASHSWRKVSRNGSLAEYDTAKRRSFRNVYQDVVR